MGISSSVSSCALCPDADATAREGTKGVRQGEGSGTGAGTG